LMCAARFLGEQAFVAPNATTLGTFRVRKHMTFALYHRGGHTAATGSVPVV
jgi:hypothetical protein